MVRRCVTGGFVLGLCLALPLAVGAAGSDTLPGRASSPAEAKLEEARTLVEDGSFEAAIPLLLEAAHEDDRNPDTYNLLGFAHRKTGKLEAALKYYEKALALEPGHRGAHEYIGEAYLEMGDVASARKHLAFLDRDCAFGCREYTMLKEAIARFEARPR
jgi:tetratricopeptide (TPR) repeat protein